MGTTVSRNKANITKQKYRFYYVPSYYDIKPTVSLLTLREIKINVGGSTVGLCYLSRCSKTSVHPEPLGHTTQVDYLACTLTVT